MKKTTKVLLLISLTAWAVGFTTHVLWGIGMPIGAIFFGLFLIFKVLENEVAKFDEEQRQRLEIADRFSSPVSAPESARPASDHGLARASA